MREKVRRGEAELGGLLVDGNETGNWLGVRDGIRNWLVTAA
jgi:hypothetical protein